MRKIVVLTVVGAVILLSAFLIFSRIAQSRREAAYQSAMAPFQRDLRAGTDRPDVKKYLDSHGVKYHSVRYGGSDASTLEIEIGEEPPRNLWCEESYVYIALEFTAEEKLQQVHIRKIGTCL